MAKERIDKLLAHEGFGSRKDIRKLLRGCEVLVNGQRIYDAGFAVDAENDSISVDGEEINLFDQVWTNHYTLFETMATSNYLETTYYAMNHSYKVSDYEKAFTSDSLTTCPISAPLVMYFDFSEENPLKDNQKVAGLSDIIFTVEGSSDLERARTLKNCWAHADKFGKLMK